MSRFNGFLETAEKGLMRILVFGILLCFRFAQADCIQSTVSELLLKQGVSQSEIDMMDRNKFKEVYGSLAAVSSRDALILKSLHETCLANTVKDTLYTEHYKKVCPKSKSPYKSICVHEFLVSNKPKTVTGLSLFSGVIVSAAGLDKLKSNNRSKVETYMVNSLIELSAGFTNTDHLFYKMKTKGIIDWCKLQLYKFVEEELFKEYLKKTIPLIESHLADIEKGETSRGPANVKSGKGNPIESNLRNKLKALKQKRPLDL